MTKQYPIKILLGFFYMIDDKEAKYTGHRKHVFCTAPP